MSGGGVDVAVIDCGMGNLHSVEKALAKVAPRQSRAIVSRAIEIERARKIVLPGDGAFDSCLGEIRRRGLENAIRRAAREKPFFGVCVGMQALFESSEEGGADAVGLGVFAGRLARLPRAAGKIPHFGWSQTWQTKPHPFFAGVEDGARFYFIHSYAVEARDGGDDFVSGVCNYGVDFAAVVARDNVFATQFHPEKSRGQGLRLLENFCRAH